MFDAESNMRLGSLTVTAHRDRFILSDPHSPGTEIELFKSEAGDLLEFIGDRLHEDRRGARWGGRQLARARAVLALGVPAPSTALGPSTAFGPNPERRAQPDALRLVVADDHALVRAGVAQMLEDEPDFRVVGQAADGVEAVKLSARLRPDLVVMDVSMPRLGGVRATRAIRAHDSHVKVVGLSMHRAEAILPRMFEAGAAAYVEKAAPPDELLDALRVVCGRGSRRGRGLPSEWEDLGGSSRLGN